MFKTIFRGLGYDLYVTDDPDDHGTEIVCVEDIKDKFELEMIDATITLERKDGELAVSIKRRKYETF